MSLRPPENFVDRGLISKDFLLHLVYKRGEESVLLFELVNSIIFIQLAMDNQAWGLSSP